MRLDAMRRFLAPELKGGSLPAFAQRATFHLAYAQLLIQSVSYTRCAPLHYLGIAYCAYAALFYLNLFYLRYTEIPEDCAICLDPLEEDLVIANCSHIFHRDCLDEWRSRRNNCPLDRNRVTQIQTLEK